MRQFDKSTNDGTVVEGIPDDTLDGVPLTFLGATVVCPSCKQSGVIVGVGPRFPDTSMGKQMALEGDICMCGCEPHPHMIASQNRMFEDHQESATRSGPAKTIIGGVASVITGTFDEQVRPTGRGASDGYPYFIETADGRIFSGRLDRDGHLPRVCTDAENNYGVYWGDEALAKQDGA